MVVHIASLKRNTATAITNPRASALLISTGEIYASSEPDIVTYPSVRPVSVVINCADIPYAASSLKNSFKLVVLPKLMRDRKSQDLRTFAS